MSIGVKDGTDFEVTTLNLYVLIA